MLQGFPAKEGLSCVLFSDIVARENTQLSPSLTRNPCICHVDQRQPAITQRSRNLKVLTFKPGQYITHVELKFKPLVFLSLLYKWKQLQVRYFFSSRLANDAQIPHVITQARPNEEDAFALGRSALFVGRGRKEPRRGAALN